MAEPDSDEIHLIESEPLESEPFSPEAASSDSVFSIPEMQLPIIGCEILEARRRFTVYKICVQVGRNNSWFVFRRYSEFYNLYSGLRQIYPHFYIEFPRKKYFGDNFDEKLLTFRRRGLQLFLNKLLELEDVLSKKVMVDFLCLDDPPGPYDSLEQSRAFITHLEESLHQTKRKYNEKVLELHAFKWHCTQVKAQRFALLTALRTERALNGKNTFENDDELLLREYLGGDEVCQLTQSYESLITSRKSRSSGSFRSKMSASSSCNSLLEANITLAKISTPRTSWCESNGSNNDVELSVPSNQRQRKPNTSHLPSYNEGGLFNKLLCRSTEALQKIKDVVTSSFGENPAPGKTAEENGHDSYCHTTID